MKKTLVLGALMCVCTLAMAQEVNTYSVYDTDHNGEISITDVTGTVSQIKQNTAALSTQQYVTAEELKTLLDYINERLDKLTRLESWMALISEEVGAMTPEGYEEFKKFQNHEYVDLGLKDAEGNTIYWAKCNVGAYNFYDYGNYYAWGETKGLNETDPTNAHNMEQNGSYIKTFYDWYSYKYCNTGSWKSLTKYTMADGNTSANWYDGDTFVGDGKATLDPEDDAATVNWGGAWRMPTKEEVDQLRTECTWEWTTQCGVKGHVVRGPNGNTIFLPACGYRDEDDLFNKDEYGNYWTSSIWKPGSNCAYYLCVGGNSYKYTNSHLRCMGRCVRPVCK